MPFYEDMQNVVSEVLGGEFKQGVINYVHTVPGDGPDDNPGPPNVTSYPVNGTAGGVKFKYVQSGQALESDVQVVAPVDPLYTPTPKGHVEIDGVKYKIHKLLPKPLAGTPVAYVFILRK